MKSVMLVLGGLLLGAAPLASQQHEHAPAPADSVARAESAGMMEMMRSMHGDMSGAMGGMGGSMGHEMDLDCPCLPLQMRRSLGLSADQIGRLEEIQRRASEQQEERLRGATEADQAATMLLHGAAPDLAAYEARLREAAGQRVEARLARARALLKAHAVLTAVQRERLRPATEMMRELIEGRR